MPDPTGFLHYGRQLPPRRPVSARVHDWHEVYESADEELIREQATRCMNCGIPFCHNGCPLGNRIPDWNDLVRTGQWDFAAEELHATNNFPEFTGRLCPALCEASCVLGVRDDPVTVRQVEVEIINRAFDRGRVVPQPTQAPSGQRVAVVGSGPAGLAAAQQLARAGHRVTVFERSDAIGGLLRYGIPDFKLEKQHIDRRLEQLAGEGVEFVTGCEAGVDISTASLRKEYGAILLACGSHAHRDVAETPGRNLSGIHLAMQYLTGANRVVAGSLAEPTISAAGKHVIVIGGGDTAADCLGVANRQGAAGVHLLDVIPEPPAHRDSARDPWPTWPSVLRTYAAHEEGGERIFGASVKEFLGDEQGRLRAVCVVDVTVSTQGGFTVTPVPGTERELPAELVLLAIGFAGTQPGPLLDGLGLVRDRRGTIGCDAEWQTSTPGVFVAGDMHRGPSLITWAIADGRSVAAAIHRYLGGAGNLPAPVTPASASMRV